MEISYKMHPTSTYKKSQVYQCASAVGLLDVVFIIGSPVTCIVCWGSTISNHWEIKVAMPVQPLTHYSPASAAQFFIVHFFKLLLFCGLSVFVCMLRCKTQVRVHFARHPPHNSGRKK